MIITRAPLRITLGGGGTDLPSYYRKHGGFVISAAIDRYIYIALHKTFTQELIIKYSKMERVATADQVEHPIIREALKLVNINKPYLEISSMADAPPNSGLGSSSSFTVALLRALYAMKGDGISHGELAEKAVYIEKDLLGGPVGKQDQYIASYGGLTCFTFQKDDSVTVEPLRISQETLYNLESNLLMFYTGYQRSAGDILSDQDKRSKASDRSMEAHLHTVREMGEYSRDLLERGELRGYGELLHDHWILKKKRHPEMSNPKIDEWYYLAESKGALGGKLIGAGGGGFLLFYTEDPVGLRRVMTGEGLQEVKIRFDFVGATVMVNS